MNSIAQITENDLLAYVDDRLDAQRRAQVEAHLAQHPQDAERVRQWREQNRMLHAQFDSILSESIPAPLQETVQQQRSPKLWRVAAMTSMLFIGGALGYLLHGQVATTVIVHEPFTGRAILAHKIYAAEVLHPVEVGADQEAHLLQWLSKRMGHPLRTPDLQQYGYQLVGGRLLPGKNNPAAQLMYQDKTGKRLTIYVSVKDASMEQTGFRIEEQNGHQVLYWVDDKFGFVLMGLRDRALLLDIAKKTYLAMSY